MDHRHCPDCGHDHMRPYAHPVRCDACCAWEDASEQCERALQPLREALGMPARPRAELVAAAVSALRALEHSSAALARISTALTATGREADTPAAIADAVEEALLDHLPAAPADGGDCGGE